MHTPAIISLLMITLLLHLQPTIATDTCPPYSCNRTRPGVVQFPFRVTQNQTYQCGYPGFELSCNTTTTQTLLTLPSHPSHPFTVRAIDYADQVIWISDPNHCSPNRVLNLDLTNSPYNPGPDSSEYTFLNCSRPVPEPDKLPLGSSVVSCMSGKGYTVVSTFESTAEKKMEKEWGCSVIKKVLAPLSWPEFGYGYYPIDISDVFIQLSWDVPGCGGCVIRGGSCGFVDYDSSLAVRCLYTNAGLSKGAKYGLILGAGIPSLVCMVALTLYMSGRVRARNQNRHRANMESSQSVFPQPIIVTLGLDRPTIESYPKTVLGESKRLPKSSDGMCPICLSEYQPKETLRSIPECNHYFHAECIDEWLRLNATCPLCRNSPQKYSAEASC